MNSIKSDVLKWFNPRKYLLREKIHLLSFSIVILTILFLSFAGLFLFKKTLTRNTYTNLNNIADVKAQEIESKVLDLNDKFLNLSNSDNIQTAISDFKGGFDELESDKGDMLVTDTLEKLQVAVQNYYLDELSVISPVSGKNIVTYMPTNGAALIAQSLYILYNPEITGNKREFITGNGYASYITAHSNHHPYFLDLCKDLNASDILLIDAQSGNVIYTVNKNIDFATNLYDGPFKNSSLAKTYRITIASSEVKSRFIDFEASPATFDQPVAYFSVPVFSDNKITGILVIEYDSRLFDNILFDNLTLLKKSSLDFAILGDDLYLRNNPRGFLSDRNEYLKRLKRHSTRAEMHKILQIESLGCLVKQVIYPFETKNHLNKTENVLIADYLDKNVLASIKKLNIQGVNLYLIAKQNRTELYGHLFRLIRYTVLIMILIVIIVYITGQYFSKRLVTRINNLNCSLLQLYKGEKPKVIESTIADEIGQTIETYNHLRNRIIATSEFALEMSETNFNHEFEILSQDDNLGKSMNILKDKMVQSKEEHEIRSKEDEIRNWINSGIATFNDLLRQDNSNITALSYLVIENMVEYINANQGGVFLVEEDEDGKKSIRLAASYAFNRRKYNKKKLEITEGLIGTCYQEKKPILLKNIPDDYLEITSGLGQSKPRNLYIVPLKIDEEVLSIIEIASFNEFEQRHLDFINKVADSIAATFVSVRLNMKTVELLKESNRRSEEIAQQEEEMRQNIEEMHATQEELARAKQEEEVRSREMQLKIDSTRQLLKNLLNAIPGAYILKDQNGVVHLVNKEGAEFYGLSINAILGKNDNELLSAQNYEKEHKADHKAIESGIYEYIEKKEVMGELKKFKVTKKPFFIDDIHQTGILTIRIIVED